MLSKKRQQFIQKIKDDPVLAGRIADNFRFKFGHTHSTIKATFANSYGIDGDEFEELMMEADRLASYRS